MPGRGLSDNITRLFRIAGQVRHGIKEYCLAKKNRLAEQEHVKLIKEDQQEVDKGFPELSDGDLENPMFNNILDQPSHRKHRAEQEYDIDQLTSTKTALR